MIKVYTGTPGSGKSLHVAKDIYYNLLAKKTVIANFPIAVEKINKNGKRKVGNFVYKDYSELTIKFLYDYARANNKIGIEGQTLVVIDECQVIFNPRDLRRDRLKWVEFFTQHRKLGYNIILVTPFDRLIDRQIRACVEYECKHMKNNNNGLMGMLLPFALFSSLNYWYGVKKLISSDVFVYRKKFAEIYDSYKMFSDLGESEV